MHCQGGYNEVVWVSMGRGTDARLTAIETAGIFREGEGVAGHAGCQGTSKQYWPGRATTWHLAAVINS